LRRKKVWKMAKVVRNEIEENVSSWSPWVLKSEDTVMKWDLKREMENGKWRKDPFEGHKWNILPVLILLENDFSRVKTIV